MRVLVVHNDYQQEGGEIRSVRDEVGALTRLGVDVRLHLQSNSDFTEHPAHTARSALTSGPSMTAFEELLLKVKPDVVHLQNGFPTIGPGLVQALQRVGLPYIRTLRNYRLRCLSANLRRDGEDCTKCESSAGDWWGVRYRCYRGSLPLSAAGKWYAVRERRAEVAHPPAAYIVLGNRMRELLHASLLQDVPVYVKPNSVQLSTVPSLGRGARQGVLFVGRLDAQKGTRRVIEMAAHLRDVPFTVIGSGPEEGDVHRAAREIPNLKYLGRRSAEETLAAMASAVIVVVPSDWEEPFGRVAIEALSVGTPPLTSNRGELPHIVGGIDRSLVVGDGQWLEAVARLLDMPAQKYEALSDMCREHASAVFSSEAGGRALVDIYRTATS